MQKDFDLSTLLKFALLTNTGKQVFNGHHSNVFNKNNQANAGDFISGHHNVANKGNNANFGNKGQLGHNAHYGQAGGQNFASGFGKGMTSID